MRMLDAFKQRNHKVYLQRNMISIEQINHLAVCQGTYCHSVVKNPQHAEIKFTRGELMANGTLMVLMLRQKDPSNIMASSADGFHRYNSGDKRSFATVNLQENLKKADVYSQLSDQFRCHFSCLNLSGILFTEVLELITWNSYVAYKNILRTSSMMVATVSSTTRSALSSSLNASLKELLTDSAVTLRISPITLSQAQSRVTQSHGTRSCT
jgi:hypothetical protein